MLRRLGRIGELSRVKIEVEINGRRRAVSIEPAGGNFRVSVDGRTRTVDLAFVEPSALSLIFPDESGAAHEIRVSETGRNGELTVCLHGREVHASVNGVGPPRGPRRPAPGVAAEGIQRIAAPMPGKVVRVLVAPGDAVAARQAMVVVEAMKMENEFRSPKAGVVKEVPVKEGMSVDAGALLVVVE